MPIRKQDEQLESIVTGLGLARAGRRATLWTPETGRYCVVAEGRPLVALRQHETCAQAAA